MDRHPRPQTPEIATTIAKDHSLEFEWLEPFRREDLPLASYVGLDGLFRFVLVPGGRFSLGLSDAEVRVLEEFAAPHRGEATFDQDASQC